MAFALQSIQKRLPKSGSAVGGIRADPSQRLRGSEEGTVDGMRWLVSVSLALGVVSLAIQWRLMPHHEPPDVEAQQPRDSAP